MPEPFDIRIEDEPLELPGEPSPFDIRIEDKPLEEVNRLAELEKSSAEDEANYLAYLDKQARDRRSDEMKTMAEGMGTMERIGRGLAEGATMGHGEQLTSGNALRYLSPLYNLLSDGLSEEEMLREQLKQKAATGTTAGDLSQLGGQAATGVGLSYLLPSAGVAGLASQAALGGALGAASVHGENPEAELSDYAIPAGAGAAIGAIPSGLGMLRGKLTPKATISQAGEVSQELADLDLQRALRQRHLAELRRTQKKIMDSPNFGPQDYPALQGVRKAMLEENAWLRANPIKIQEEQGLRDLAMSGVEQMQRGGINPLSPLIGAMKVGSAGAEAFGFTPFGRALGPAVSVGAVRSQADREAEQRRIFGEVEQPQFGEYDETYAATRIGEMPEEYGISPESAGELRSVVSSYVNGPKTQQDKRTLTTRLYTMQMSDPKLKSAMDGFLKEDIYLESQDDE